jgi:thiamine-monophosphate kinase
VGSPKLGYTQSRGEDEIVERIRHTLGGGIEAFGLRDDAGLLEVPGGGSLVVSVDSVVDGVHVELGLCSPADVGWKALMGALSDLAAMGARPVGALVALTVPEGEGDGSVTVAVMEGVAEAGAASECPIVGGDLTSGPVLVVSVTVIGTVDGGDPVTRAGARPGDVVMITGPCGGSAAGLRKLRAGSTVGPVVDAYRRPVARLGEGVAARLGGATAMIDVSDGLALDLHRLADASNVGFALETVPVAVGATPNEALGGGEDYELLLTMDAMCIGAFVRACEAQGLQQPVQIGVIRDDTATRTCNGHELARTGWQHRVG